MLWRVPPRRIVRARSRACAGGLRPQAKRLEVALKPLEHRILRAHHDAAGGEPSVLPSLGSVSARVGAAGGESAAKPERICWRLAQGLPLAVYRMIVPEHLDLVEDPSPGARLPTLRKVVLNVEAFGEGERTAFEVGSVGQLCYPLHRSHVPDLQRPAKPLRPFPKTLLKARAKALRLRGAERRIAEPAEAHMVEPHIEVTWREEHPVYIGCTFGRRFGPELKSLERSCAPAELLAKPVFDWPHAQGGRVLRPLRKGVTRCAHPLPVGRKFRPVNRLEMAQQDHDRGLVCHASTLYGLWHTRPMRFEWHLSWAYWRGRRALRGGNGFISFIALLSVLGIALGVAALITVLSVMNGFQKEVRNRMLSVVSHLEVRRIAPPSSDDAAMRARIATHASVLGIAPYEPMQVLVMREDILRGALVRGVDPAQEGEVSTMFAALPELLRRSLEPGRWRVLLGRELARSLGVIPGDRIVFMAPDLGDQGAGFMPRLRQFEVAGLFESGHFEYDSTLALIHIEDALRLNRQDAPTHWRILTADPMQVRQTAAALAGRLDERYQLRDWSQENRVWFEAVQVEKRMMFIILTLIVAVASFNLVSMLVMTVVDKRSDIAILRSMGASRASIMRIFMFQGFASGSLGTLLGLGLGVAIVASLDAVLRQLEKLFGFEVLPKGVYLLQRIPTDMHAADLVQVGLIALVLAFLATLYPSWRAARSRPADALRHA